MTTQADEVYSATVRELMEVLNELPAALRSHQAAKREESLARGRTTTVQNHIRQLKKRAAELTVALDKMDGGQG